MADDDPGGLTKATIYDTDDFVRLYAFKDGWTPDATSVPTVDSESVDRHFGVASCKQLKKGWAFKEECYVKKIMVNVFDPDPTICLVRSLCAPSMKPGHYKQLISISRSAEVVQAYCDCVAGLSGTCQHVAGLMFALADIQEPSTTDVKCQWIAPAKAKKKMTTTLKDITFRKHVLSKPTPKQPKRRVSAAQTSAGSENLQTGKIMKKLAAADPSMLWNRYMVEAPQQNQQRVIGDTEDLLSRRCTDIARLYVSSVPPLSDGERRTVCETTVGQQANPAWRREKIGRLGASMFRRIIHCIRPEGVVRDILYTKVQSLKPGDPRQYGIDNEPIAVSAYVSFMACQGRDIAVEETGLHVHKEYPFVAVSPDRIVFEGSDRGVLEVKCPPSKKGMTPAEACASDDFCCHIVDGSVVLKETHAYYFQIQGQMAVVGAQWCDFVVWTNNGALWQSLSVERVPFDKLFWENKILPGLLYFYQFALVPELITRRIKRLNFLHTIGRGYVPYLKYKDGFYVCDSDPDSLKVCIRKLK